MPARKRSKSATEPTVVPDLAVSLDRISKMMAMSLVKTEEGQAEKIRMLASYGFSHGDIAQLLGITTNGVAVALYRTRAKK